MQWQVKRVTQIEQAAGGERVESTEVAEVERRSEVDILAPPDQYHKFRLGEWKMLEFVMKSSKTTIDCWSEVNMT